MFLKQTLIATALVLAPVAAFAGGSVDVFYTDNTLELNGLGGGDADGSGYGFRGQAELGKGFSIIGLNQESRIKGNGTGSLELSETRLGLSYKHQLNRQTSLIGTLEKVSVGAQQKDQGFGITLDGFVANVGLNVNVAKNVNAYGSVGYGNLGKVANETVDGYEYTAGVSYDFSKNWAGFAEYRIVNLEVDNADIDNDTLRVGGRYTF